MKFFLLLLVLASTLTSCATFKRISEGEPAALEDATPPAGYNPFYIKQLAPAPADPAAMPKSRLEISWIDAREPNRVKIYAHLVDESGNYYTGATLNKYKGDWCNIIDSSANGQKTVTKFTLKEASEKDRARTALAYLLDHSGSMGSDRAYALEQAAVDLMGKKDPDDAAAILKYDSKVVVEAPISKNADEIKSKIGMDGLTGYGGGTAILNAIGTGLETLKEALGYDRKAVVLFTDGQDNSSTMAKDSLLREARKNNVLVASIAFGEGVQEDFLKDIVQRTGGVYRKIYQTKELNEVFDDLYHRLRNYYLIEYTPTSYGVHNATIQLCLPHDTLVASGVYDNTPNIGDVTLLDINFDLNSSNVAPASLPSVEDVVTLMKAYPTLRIDVRGHTDNSNKTGDADYNQKLSQKRADAVKKEILKRGIDQSRVTTAGFGDSKPLADNATEEGRAKNRRTEFVITAR